MLVSPAVARWEAESGRFPRAPQLGSLTYLVKFWAIEKPHNKQKVSSTWRSHPRMSSDLHTPVHTSTHAYPIILSWVQVQVTIPNSLKWEVEHISL